MHGISDLRRGYTPCGSQPDARVAGKYDVHMDVSVSAFRAELKTWIERANAGETIVITDRGIPVARLTGVASSDLISDLTREGLLTVPGEPRTTAPTPVPADGGGDGRGGDGRGVSGIFSRRRR